MRRSHCPSMTYNSCMESITFVKLPHFTWHVYDFLTDEAYLGLDLSHLSPERGRRGEGLGRLPQQKGVANVAVCVSSTITAARTGNCGC